jgi:hypothetical protein
MTGAQLKKFVLTPVVLSAAVFAALSSPLAIFGSKPLTIQLQEEPVFQGQLRDFSAPYLGLTSAMSLAAGIASVAVSGWRLSARKSSQTEAQLSELEQDLKEKEVLLEQLKLSEARLDASGLSQFVDEEVTQKPAQETLEANQAPLRVVNPLVITTQPLEALAVVQSLETEQAATTGKAATSRFASAQTFLGYSQAKALVKPSTTTSSPAPESPAPESPAPEEVEFLHTQLQQIMAQMASLQTAISSTPVALSSETQVPAKSEPPEVVKSWSVHEMVS